ncbi:MAG: 50S ribosomal protein L17, partial [Candidatus Omnitrophica bacterium]|nr:50S ribosomal protein L17 [Candidatus Omnitrophota bacterium]
MRHRKGKKRLNRPTSSRKALLSNLLKSLFQYERIKTTEPRAKELVKIAEHLITLAKEDKLSHRRYAFSYLQDKN